MKTLYKHNRSIILFLIFFIFSNSFTQISTIIPDYGFGYNQNEVVTNWISSGAIPINAGFYNIDTLIDVNEEGIYPGSQPVGQQIKDLIQEIEDNFNGIEQVMLYFPAGSYIIEKPLSIPQRVILKGAGGDGSEDKQTHFHFQYPDAPDPVGGNCISFESNTFFSAIEDICLFDDNNPVVNVWKNGQMEIFTRYNDLISIPRTAYNNWIRGVEAVKTRRFHVNIYGKRNTVSGCYFHHSWDYGPGGRGYGVCLSGSLDFDFGSRYNRIEDNIFNHLRHSMVFQFNPQFNVVAYNFSIDRQPNFSSADLLFHGNKGGDNFTHIGPKWNLCEGNICERIRFDEYHYQNGPYNTIFRCYADRTIVDEINEYNVTNQYKQNFVGCNSDPTGNTKDLIDYYGYFRYWEDRPNWELTPSDSCSYYQEIPYDTRPAFYDNLAYGDYDWPFLPNSNYHIPSSFRYGLNTGDCIGRNTTEVVFAGWDLYPTICGPPNIYRSNSDPISNLTSELIAMRKIEAGPYELATNNDITFKCENQIVLKSGFKVNAINNNYFHAIAGDICNSKVGSNDIDYQIYLSDSLPLNSENTFSVDDSQHIVNKSESVNSFANLNSKTNSITIGPNPNNGIFSVYFRTNNLPTEYQILNLHGNIIFENEIDSHTNIQINISDKPKGVYLLKLIFANSTQYQKIFYQ